MLQESPCAPDRHRPLPTGWAIPISVGVLNGGVKRQPDFPKQSDLGMRHYPVCLELRTPVFLSLYLYKDCVDTSNVLDNDRVDVGDLRV